MRAPRIRMPSILLHLLTTLGYAALAAYLWHRLVHRGGGGSAATTRLPHALIALPLAMHAFLLATSIHHADGLYLGVGNAVSVIIALAVLIYWMGSFFYRLEALHVLVLPAAAVLSFLPYVLPATHPLANTASIAFKAHLMISLLAYSLFTIASLHVLLMAFAERRLHAGNVPPYLQALPPLLTMETLLFRIIAACLVFLTFTLGSGMLFSEEVFGKPLTLTHKTVFGVLSWLIFSALLLGRAMYGWRGRIALRWTLAGFMSLLLAYVGSRFVLEVILQR
jgi:ABC-type uncharacterized transport system permease subunit